MLNGLWLTGVESRAVDAGTGGKGFYICGRIADYWGILRMKTKATSSLDAAQVLIDKEEEGYYTASIHCTYYAVFQYIKYVLANTDTESLSYEEQTAQAKGKSSHDFVINQICKRIGSTKKARKFRLLVRDLKQERVDADYSTRQFTLEESLACKRQAEELIAKLKMYFGDL